MGVVVVVVVLFAPPASEALEPLLPPFPLLVAVVPLPLLGSTMTGGGWDGVDDDDVDIIGEDGDGDE